MPLIFLPLEYALENLRGTNMKKLKEWLLKRLIREQVKQGPNHERNIREMYRTIRLACQDEFYEDNQLSLDLYLRDRFEDAIKS